MIRTSITHPLRIDSLPVANGRVGITLCPGKKGCSVHESAWNRDLDIDLNVIEGWGADAIVTLMEDRELDMLEVPDLGYKVEARGIAWHHFPIKDVSIPSNSAMDVWRSLTPELHAILERGGRVLVHCRGGLGRAGLVAALLVSERGPAARKAIEMVLAARPSAIETQDQAQWLERRARHHDLAGIRLHTCLLGGAIGDSLGAEIEFLSLRAIRDRYPEGIEELPPHGELRGAITDDTQMTLFSAEGLIRSHIRGTLSGACAPEAAVHYALLRWYRTQDGTPRTATDSVGLIQDKRLWQRRAPGNTCLSAPSKSNHIGDAARNDSKGCGTIMRVAPVALMTPRAEVRELAIRTSALTHGHLTAQSAAAAWAELLADVASGEALEPTAQALAEVYDNLEHGAETARAIRSSLNATVHQRRLRRWEAGGPQRRRSPSHSMMPCQRYVGRRATNGGHTWRRHGFNGDCCINRQVWRVSGFLRSLNGAQSFFQAPPLPT